MGQTAVYGRFLKRDSLSIWFYKNLLHRTFGIETGFGEKRPFWIWGMGLALRSISLFVNQNCRTGLWQISIVFRREGLCGPEVRFRSQIEKSKYGVNGISAPERLRCIRQIWLTICRMPCVRFIQLDWNLHSLWEYTLNQSGFLGIIHYQRARKYSKSPWFWNLFRKRALLNRLLYPLSLSLFEQKLGRKRAENRWCATFGTDLDSLFLEFKETPAQKTGEKASAPISLENRTENIRSDKTMSCRADLHRSAARAIYYIERLL